MSFKDGFSALDGSADFGRVDAMTSINVEQDARGLVTQSRSHFSNYLMENCSDLSPWTIHTGGTATVTQETIGDDGTANPAGTEAFVFSTGCTANSYCAINRTLTTLPASYGVGGLNAMLAVSDSPQDAFQMAVQNTVDGRVLNLLLYKDHITVGDSSGSFHLLSTHSPVYSCENWIENKDNGDGTNTVTLWQGTEHIGSQTVTMLTQSNPGLVYMQQGSGAHTDQKSDLRGLWIGDTQLPDEGLLQGLAWTTPFKGQGVNLSFDVENVCNSVVVNTDFTAAFIHNGTEVPVSLTDLCVIGKGIVDFTKDVHTFGGTFPRTLEQGDTLAYKCHMLSGKLMAILGVTIQPVAIY